MSLVLTFDKHNLTINTLSPLTLAGFQSSTSYLTLRVILLTTQSFMKIVPLCIPNHFSPNSKCYPKQFLPLKTSLLAVARWCSPNLLLTEPLQDFSF